MKLLSLQIEGYKNLKEQTEVNFDFTKCTTYTALIGLNGSGKSNILEAVSLIFSSLYHGTKLKADFSYNISYKLEDKTIVVSNGVMTFTQDEKEGTTAVAKSAHQEHLPSNIITSYSGEELRMWENVYFESYKVFFREIKNQEGASPKLLYLNKYTWEFALIALLCSENQVVKDFVKDILNIDVEAVKITFDFNTDNIKTYPTNQSIEYIQQLIKAQLENKNELSIDQIQVINYQTFTSTDVVKEMFYSLFITGMPVKNSVAKINAQKIIKGIDIKFNDIDFKKLSEGEKKLILLHTIIELLADDKTLVLLDEPDAHIHIERKKEIIDIIDKPDCFTLFTTHSPKILNCLNDENIRLIRNIDDKGVEVIHLDKPNTLNQITNGEFSIIDATLALSTSKDILLVEGTNDYNYIMKAIEKLSPDYDNYPFHIINCGGADNVPAVLEQSLLSVIKDEQLCLCTFDYDGQGIRNHKKIIELAANHSKPNIKAMYHTKLDGTEHKDKEDFYMENLFPVDTYKDVIVASINGKTTFKQLEEYQKPKSIIQKTYKGFDRTKFENFRVLLDKTIETQTEFHK